MNCQIVFLDNVNQIQNLVTDEYPIKVPRVKKTLGSIFDELANFLNKSTEEQRDNYDIIYMFDDNDYYYLIAMDKTKEEKCYSMNDTVYNTIMKNVNLLSGERNENFNNNRS
jgi:hypothetical protein